MASENDPKWDIQLRKGTLELIILAALKGRTLYGLELLKLLKGFETTVLTEGTLYPLLDRLKRDQLIHAQWIQEGESRPRKYFSLTPIGEQRLHLVSQRWQQSVQDISYLLAHPGPEPLN